MLGLLKKQRSWIWDQRSEIGIVDGVVLVETSARLLPRPITIQHPFIVCTVLSALSNKGSADQPDLTRVYLVSKQAF